MVTGVSSEEKVVVFRIGDEEFGMEVLAVSEIIRPTEITPLPRAPKSVIGLINLRGTVIPVIDARERFNLPRTEFTSNERIVVINLSDNQQIGLQVDMATEILKLSGDEVVPIPNLAIGKEVKDVLRAVANIGDRLIILLDPGKILPSRSLSRISLSSRTVKSMREAQVE
ncbi:MAG: purine-binding chemotaxis protein CheW [Actinobacteria bacterium]|nr:purine-binding chemotaxis protein CheW [Actinomycetota bacterium]